MASKSKEAHHRRLNGKYLKDAKELIKKGDYSQASEKLWGASVEIVKALAAKRENKTLGEHRQILEYVSKLDKEFPDMNLRRLISTARALHSNFYEDEFPADYVSEVGYQAVEEFIDKMKRILEES